MSEKQASNDNPARNKAAKEQAKYSDADELGGLEVLEAKYHHQNFSRHSHEGFFQSVTLK